MKKILATILFISIAINPLFANDVNKGQKTYLKTLKQRCGVTGAKFAAYHTQDEWNDLKQEGSLYKDIKEKCEKAPELNEDQLTQLHAFFVEYASDSGNVPSCGD